MLALLTVHGGGTRKVNWGEHRLLQAPSPGDLISAKGPDGKLHYLTVRHTEYSAVPVGSTDEPEAIIVTDWKASYEA